jgi:hypothetical protein
VYRYSQSVRGARDRKLYVTSIYPISKGAELGVPSSYDKIPVPG